MEFSLNDGCTVTLTAFGKETYEKHFASYGIEKKAPDILETQMWDLMLIFGPVLRAGFANMPFVDNKVDIESTANLKYAYIRTRVSTF